MDLMIHDNAKRSARFCILKGIGMNMIKGVGRYAIEVESVDSEFFERVICFVRPQYACGSALDLHREAARMADDLSAEVEDAQHGTRHVLRVNSRPQRQPERREEKHLRKDYPETPPKRNGWIPILLSAGGGAAAAMLITAIF